MSRLTSHMHNSITQFSGSGDVYVSSVVAAVPEQHAPVQESARAAAPAAALPLLRSEAVRHPRPVAAAG